MTSVLADDETLAERRPAPVAATGRRLRLCVVTEAFLPDYTGGQVTQARELGELLVDRGVDVTIVTRLRRPHDAPLVQVGRLPVVRLGRGDVLKGRGPAAILPMADFLLRSAAWLVRHRGEFDVWIALGVKFLPMTMAPAGRLVGRPVIAKPESNFEFEQAVAAESLAQMGGVGRLVGRFAAALRDLMLRLSTCTVAMSPELHEHMRRSGVPDERNLPIANGVDLERFNPVGAAEKLALRRKLGLPETAPVFIYTGRLVHTKGLMTLVAAWERVVARQPDARLLLLGTGEGSFDSCEEEIHAQLAATGLAHTCTIPGNLDLPEDWLRASDVYVFPSHYEGFGLALIEAMACGLPVVSTPVGVAPQAVQEGVNGLFAPLRDVEGWAAAMGRMLDDRARWPALGAASHAAVVQRYNLRRTADAYRDLIERLARTGSPVVSRQPAR